MDWSEIKNHPFVERFEHFDSIESTNSYAKTITELPVQGLHVIQADIQSAGRGQRSNSFVSNIQGGLWASVIVPFGDISLHFVYNRAIIMAIFDTVHEFIPHAQIAIKWPNDLICNDKKICGILLETTSHSTKHMIIGFGLNVNNRMDQFPHDVAQIATTMKNETGIEVSLQDVFQKIIGRFEGNINLDYDIVHQLYCKRLYGVEKKISIQEQTGIFTGILEDGRLCLNNGNRTVYFSSGPMQVLSE